MILKLCLYYFYFNISLSVSLFSAVLAFGAVFEDVDFFAAALFKDFALDGAAGNVRFAYGSVGE